MKEAYGGFQCLTNNVSTEHSLALEDFLGTGGHDICRLRWWEPFFTPSASSYLDSFFTFTSLLRDIKSVTASVLWLFTVSFFTPSASSYLDSFFTFTSLLRDIKSVTASVLWLFTVSYYGIVSEKISKIFCHKS
ncbi:Hypothetical predicted protein [Octopus vulgaris]|uniref:Uncharacterized protein n=1 Tax=Octopus vulgaris TaxID=6645 RepID=A0AA36BFR0_OCTVU|nr:Hypothetical predicted protein [Octopus vulgaris]